MKVVPDIFSVKECEEIIRYDQRPFVSRWCIIFESEQEAEEVKNIILKLMVMETG